jgi:hypothetical protein
MSKSEQAYRHQIQQDEWVEEIGLDEEEIAWRKEFLGFDGEDARRAADLGRLVEDEEDLVAATDLFMDPILEYDRTRAVFERGTRTDQQLRGVVHAYYNTFTSGSYDRATSPSARGSAGSTICSTCRFTSLSGCTQTSTLIFWVRF